MQGQCSFGRAHMLAPYQVARLENSILRQMQVVHGAGNFPTLPIWLCDFLVDIKTRLIQSHICKVIDIRLYGSVASAIMDDHSDSNYGNDIDIMFNIDFPYHNSPSVFDMIRDTVLLCLRDRLPHTSNQSKELSLDLIAKAYVDKMFKMPSSSYSRQNHVRTTKGDCWSLLSLRNDEGRSVELKFVHTLRRQFEFTIDSFQIILDPVLQQIRAQQTAQTPVPSVESFASIVKRSLHQAPPITAAAQPSNDNQSGTIVESAWSEVNEAISHLLHKWIVIPSPEEVRGGGLLKYSTLLARGFSLPPWTSWEERLRLEGCMTTRFMIDFPRVEEQQIHISNYVRVHLRCAEGAVAFLDQLHEVLLRVTHGERADTLHMIDDFRLHVAAATMPAELFNQYHHFVVQRWPFSRHNSHTLPLSIDAQPMYQASSSSSASSYPTPSPPHGSSRGSIELLPATPYEMSADLRFE